MDSDGKVARMNHIFSDRVRTDPSRARRAETTFPFLDRVDDPVFARVRRLIEEWFAAYPSNGSDKQRGELRGRFTSGNDQDFASAFWELYLHETYRRAGYAATPHPETPTGAEIDFLMARDDGATFYLEAVGSMKNSLTGGGYPAGSAEVLDKIDYESFNPDFYLSVKQLIPGTGTPSTASVVNPVERWLASVDWSEVTKETEARPESYPRTTLTFGNGWRAEVQAIPKGSLRGQRDVGMVATEPPLGGISTARPDMLAKLKQKAGRYGQLEAPFVIALQATAVAGDEEDVSQALFGSEAVRVPVGPSGPVGEPEVVRRADGLWQWGGERRATRVSAVLAAPHFSPYSVAREWPRLWTNPWAAHPLDTASLPWPRMEPDQALNRLLPRDAPAPPWSYFDLSPDWPGQPFERARQRRADLAGDAKAS
jgi:hypothetical protein